MSERAPYSRVYWSIVDDAKFATIYDDDRHLATWLRLLIVADQAHPASAPIPHGTRRASLQALVDVGLIDLGTGHRYRIRGLDAERAKRKAFATSRPPSGNGSDPERGPNGFHTRGLSRDETRRDEERQDEPIRAGEKPDDGRVDLEAFLIINRRAPSPKQRALLDGVMERHDLTGPAWAADIMYRNPDDPIGAVIEADREWRAERIAFAQSQERPKPQPRRPRGLPQSTRELMSEWAAANVPHRGDLT